MGSDVIETVVEELPEVDKKSSYFVEVAGQRLKLKRFHRGQGPFIELLHATALPIGKYEVVGNRIIHRYDPATVIAELKQHQQQLRMQSTEFLGVVQRIAKSVGGKVTKIKVDLTEPESIAYSIALKRGATIDLAKLQRAALVDCAVVFYNDVGKEKLTVVCADTLLEALVAWYRFDRELFVLLDAECGIEAIEYMHARRVDLRLARAPTKPGPIVRELQRSVSEGEGWHSDADWKKELKSRRLFLWWDM